MLTRKEWVFEQLSNRIFKQSYLLWYAKKLAQENKPKSTVDSLILKLKYCSAKADSIDPFRYPVFLEVYNDNIDGLVRAADICSLELVNRKMVRSILPKEKKEVTFDAYTGELRLAPLIESLGALSVVLKVELESEWVRSKGNRVIARVVSDVNDLLDAVLGAIVERG